MTNPSESHLLEELSALEHIQWMNWSKTLSYRMGAAVRKGQTLEEFDREMHDRWNPTWKDYDELDWDTKEFDREYARQILGIIRKYMK